jgi:cellobiose transport system permease protein
MYMIENAFTRNEFGYAGAVAWMIFMLILVISLINVLILRRMRSVD